MKQSIKPWPGGFLPGERVYNNHMEAWVTVMGRGEKTDRDDIDNFWHSARDERDEVPCRADNDNYRNYRCWWTHYEGLSRTHEWVKDPNPLPRTVQLAFDFMSEKKR